MAKKQVDLIDMIGDNLDQIERRLRHKVLGAIEGTPTIRDELHEVHRVVKTTLGLVKEASVESTKRPRKRKTGSKRTKSGG